MFTQKAGAFVVLAVAVELSASGLVTWASGVAVALIGGLVLREVDRIVKAAAAANDGVAALTTEVALLKQRVSHLEAQRRP